jgi:hypothetical protein
LTFFADHFIFLPMHGQLKNSCQRHSSRVNSACVDRSHRAFPLLNQ